MRTTPGGGRRHPSEYAAPSEPRTEAGRRLADLLDSVGRSPYSGVSFPSAEDDILAIEAEAARPMETFYRRMHALHASHDWDTRPYLHCNVCREYLAAIEEASR